MLNATTTVRAMSPPFGEQLEPKVCQNPSCNNLVSERWDSEGRLCGRCALEVELFDREARWDRVFPTA